MDSLNYGLYIENDRLYDYAVSTARLLRTVGAVPGREAAAALKNSMARIRRCHDQVQRRYGGRSDVPAACEWLLDNWYMLQREYRAAADAYKSGGKLRAGKDGPLVVLLCKALLEAGRGRIDEERSRLFLDGFQSVTVLRRSELDLFPAAVRGAVITAAAEVCRQMKYSADTASCAAAFEALFGTLRLFSALDTEKLINAADVTSAVLAADPTGDYARMDSGTRRDYLRRVEKMARREGVEDYVVASRLIKTAQEEKRHVGFYLFSEPKGTAAALYISLNLLLTLFLSLLAAFTTHSAVAALLLLLPVSELVKCLIDFILLRTVPPRRLPRMDMRQGVPDEGRTVCVVSALLTDVSSAAAMCRRLEELRQVCKREGSNLLFGLLADLPAAKTETTPDDEKVLQAARAGITALNRRFGGGFYLFTRPRAYNGEEWTGPERKRGAITELAKLLCGRDSAMEVFGEKDALWGVKYILTLDSDTRVYPGSVGELIGAMLHPLCRPVVDGKRRVVVSGHGLIHPRMDTDLNDSNATDFALIFAGGGGCDSYGGLWGELYMNAFGNGGFVGKGIIDARAFLECTEGRFPEGRVLSHDSLEGACLRGAFMGDAEFSDGFPARPLAYYRRMHRWVRGDWQNLPWVFCRDFTAIDRWRLFDNLRRSLLAPMTLAAILAGFFLPGSGLAVAAWAALLALLSRLLVSLAESGFSRRQRFRLRRYTRLLTGVGGAIVQTFIRLWLLPYEAWVCLTAISAALWRSFVSHKKLLQWQTAAQSQSGGAGLWAHANAMWPAALLGLGLLLLSPVIIGRSAGLMWLLSPLAAYALALPAHKDTELDRADREYIISAAADNFRYFTEFMTAEDNFLPPDNFQAQPPVGLAHRTSPTNIGLAMASFIAAYDMGLISMEEAAARIGRTVDALEKMPRCIGHYYNWYDTRTLEPMGPEFISTVDSGNMYAALAAVRQALLGTDPALAERIGAIMAPMDFAPLYDFERDLFYICYDTAKGRGAGGWYDLMASEAMLTSYVAIAKGDVPVKHWRRLSRAQLQKDGYMGLASWSGTMFEYLMPELFLPVYRGSLLYESYRFCLYVQKRRGAGGLPWGISESAFYSLDAALSYRYKASGCADLALKRGQGVDMVVSPYSSFLALAVDPQAAVRNLRLLEKLGARERFGFMEAIDFTPSRSRGGAGEKVNCYMAHHVGMSILSAANAVCGGSIQRRFMADGAMGACSLLLQERLPIDGAVISRETADPAAAEGPGSTSRWRLRGGPDDTDERRCLLSNGVYNMMLSNSGRSAAALGELALYGRPYDMETDPGVTVELSVNGESRPLCPRAGYERWELAEDRAVYRGEDAGIAWELDVMTAGGDWGEQRLLRLTPERDLSAEITFSFRPIMAARADWESHPAYWKLGIRAETEGNSLLLRRVEKNGRGETWLCVACDETALFTPEDNGGGPWLASPFVTARVRLQLEAGCPAAVSFALCLGKTKDEALNGAERILCSDEPGNMVGAAAARLGMNAAATNAAMGLLPKLCAPLSAAAPKRDLWQYGVSGDLPIICCDGRAVESLPLLRQFCLLKSCGMEAELVYLSDEQGEYRSPTRRRIGEALSAVGLEALIGSRGGVWFVPQTASETVRSRAAALTGAEPPEKKRLSLPALGAPRVPGTVPLHSWSGESFEMYINQTLPSRAWQHILTNGRLSAVATDSGLGALWFQNARELRLTRPQEDIRMVHGPERLWTEINGRKISLFAANDGMPCRVSFSPGLARWEKDLGGRLVTVEAFIPPDTDARVLLVRGAEGLRLYWALQPVLSSDSAASLTCHAENGVFTAENPECFLPGTVFTAAGIQGAYCRADFSPAAMLMSFTATDAAALCCGCCPREELIELCKAETARQALDGTRDRWRALLDRLRVETGFAPLDNYISPWAGYQTIACRLLARGSLYQSGGAYGFRDQLQDSVNIMLLNGDYAREQILACCRHQYEEGDVMHWWHPDPAGDRGIRGRCSDDLLWLVWALCEYVRATGDTGLCFERERYVSSRPLEEGERDRYETPELSDSAGTVLEHARAALERCAGRGFGPHGLPLMGSGDWNDALDEAGGESAWLGWFFSSCADAFGDLLDRLGQPGSGRYRDLARSAGRAADAAWNGRWYRRGYLPDGEPLGGDERIDLLPQSWAAMSPYSDSEKVKKGLDAALSRLLDERENLVKLFDPPFSPDERHVGYISSYGEGFRENGGQYTHGAVWLAMACFRQGRPDDGWAVLRALLPQCHDLTRYGAEPFVLPADVSSAQGHAGEAGWTWYTGSAGWYFRVVTQEMLGLRLTDGEMRISPNLPELIPSYRALWRGREIRAGRDGVTVDGEKYGGKALGRLK